MTAKPGDVWRSKCGAMELRCGDYREVLADVECDAVITDPPYSERTARGFIGGNRAQHRGITYGAVTEPWCEVMLAWAQRAARWWALFWGDHYQARWYEDAAPPWYHFAPLAWTKVDPPPRFMADGPAPGCEWLTVLRPRHVLPPSRRGSRPGSYHGKTAKNDGRFGGAKPMWLMRALVRDYTLAGDTVADACAGTGTTLLAAALEGRRAIGAELDPETFEKAVKRLSSATITPPLFHDAPPKAEQVSLLGGE